MAEGSNKIQILRIVKTEQLLKKKDGLMMKDTLFLKVLQCQRLLRPFLTVAWKLYLT